MTNPSTKSKILSTLTIVTVAFVVAVVFGTLSGCGGDNALLPACESTVGGSIDTETCVGHQDLAVCRPSTSSSSHLVGCITTTTSTSGDAPGIECVETCPANGYDQTSGR